MENREDPFIASALKASKDDNRIRIKNGPLLRGLSSEAVNVYYGAKTQY